MLIWFGKNKDKLKGMNLCLTGIDNSVFINDSLCSYLGLANIFMLFWVSNGTLRLKLTESDRVHIITPSQDLDELFPENALLNDNLLPCLFSLEFTVFRVYFTVLVFLSSYIWYFGSHFAFLLAANGNWYNALLLYWHFRLHSNTAYDNLWVFRVIIKKLF